MENRDDRRRRTLKKGLLIVDTDGPAIECIVRNMSSVGAGIWMHSWMPLPERFDLMIPVDNLRVGVRLAWQGGQEVGVEFVGPSQVSLRQRPAGRRHAIEAA